MIEDPKLTDSYGPIQFSAHGIILIVEHSAAQLRHPNDATRVWRPIWGYYQVKLWRGET